MLRRSLLGAALLAVTTGAFLFTPDSAQAQGKGRGQPRGDGGRNWNRGNEGRSWSGGSGWDGYYGPGWGGYYGRGWDGYYGGGWDGYYGSGWGWGSGFGLGSRLGYYRGWGYPGYRYYDYGNSYPVYPDQMTIMTPSMGYESAYTPAAPSNENAADITVRVPDGKAEVMFDGNRTMQRGTTREFETPALEPGRDFTYKVQARWNEGGKQVEQERTIHVRAGGHAEVDFAQPMKEAAPAPKGKTEAAPKGKNEAAPKPQQPRRNY